MMASLILASTAVPPLLAQAPTGEIIGPPRAMLGPPVSADGSAVFPPLVLDPGAVDGSHEHPPGSPLFARGQLTLETLAGMFFAPTGIGPTIPTFNYVPVNLRL